MKYTTFFVHDGAHKTLLKLPGRFLRNIKLMHRLEWQETKTNHEKNIVVGSVKGKGWKNKSLAYLRRALEANRIIVRDIYSCQTSFQVSRL